MSRSRNGKGKILSALALFCAAAIAADDGNREADARVHLTTRARPKTKSGPASSIRLDVKLVLIPVTVTDVFGAPFNGLPPQAFRLFEDGIEQQLKYFAAEDAPVSLGIVFDASRSMQGKLDQSRAAVAGFFRTSMTGDEYFLVEFNDRPRILCDFTTDTGSIEKTLTSIEPRNWTSLLDAVYMAVHHVKRARNSRKVLLILSDGGDNNSRYTESEMRNLVREADVCIYSIGLGGGLIKRHARMLRELSEETGGRFYEVDRMSELQDTIWKISAAIRNQYLLGYYPSDAQNNGLYRKVEVKLDQRPDLARLRASWRTGYYAAEGN